MPGRARAGLDHGSGTLSEAKIFIDDMPSMGMLQIRAKGGGSPPSATSNMVIVDYIQLMQGRGRFENRTQELA